jgi:hypothetical protein
MPTIAENSQQFWRNLRNLPHKFWISANASSTSHRFDQRPIRLHQIVTRFNPIGTRSSPTLGSSTRNETAYRNARRMAISTGE